MDQEKEGHVNSFTLAFRDSDKERQYQVEISLTLYGLVCCGYQKQFQEDRDIGFPTSLACSLLLTLLLGGLQVGGVC